MPLCLRRRHPPLWDPYLSSEPETPLATQQARGASPESEYQAPEAEDTCPHTPLAFPQGRACNFDRHYFLEQLSYSGP